MTNDARAVLRQYIVENFLLGGDTDLGNSQSLLQTGVVDSTGILELVTFIEETYGISVADEEMLPENLDTLDNLAAFVLRKRSAPLSSALVETPAGALLAAETPQ